MHINFTQLPHGEGLDLPTYATKDSAGMDIRAAVEEDTVLKAGGRMAVATGFCMAIPEGYEAQIRSRSGLAMKHGVAVLNAPGTIDADYRGEVKAIMINLGQEDFVIERGMRIAQMVIAPYTKATPVLVSNLDKTERAAGGFGSTGTN